MRTFGSGDSALLLDVLPPDVASSAFAALRDSTPWQQLQHRGGDLPRLAHTQVLRSSPELTPVYRHPVDHLLTPSAFSPLVLLLHRHVLAALRALPITCAHYGADAQHVHLNHCLLQLYRAPADSISAHSDKTLDVAPGSVIVNLSLGARRTMRLRRKREGGKEGEEGAEGMKQAVPLPHASCFIMGLRTNAEWQHAVKADRRPDIERDHAERAEGGARISLTFRCIVTYEDTEGRLVGQGARLADGVEPGEGERLLAAFARENREALDWAQLYSGGFNVKTVAET